MQDHSNWIVESKSCRIFQTELLIRKAANHSNRIVADSFLLSGAHREKSREWNDNAKMEPLLTWADRLRFGGSTDFHSSHLSGRVTTRAEDAQGTPNQSNRSPRILVYQESKTKKRCRIWGSGDGTGQIVGRDQPLQDARTFDAGNIISEAPRSGPLSLAPVSAKELKERAF